MYDPYNVYRGRYKEFIEGILSSRPLNEKQDHNERHHVIPSCCEGTDDNVDNIIINLKCKEHFIAHKILAEENPYNEGLVYTYLMMCSSRNVSTPEDYEEAKILNSSLVSKRFTGKPSWNSGKKLSDEHKLHLSDSHKGLKLSDDAKKKVSLSLIGNTRSKGKPRVFTEEHCKNISEGKKGKKMVCGVKYHHTCKLCGAEFVGNSSNCKYCFNCKEVVYK